jgi:hypothetical protein
MFVLIWILSCRNEKKRCKRSSGKWTTTLFFVFVDILNVSELKLSSTSVSDCAYFDFHENI